MIFSEGILPNKASVVEENSSSGPRLAWRLWRNLRAGIIVTAARTEMRLDGAGYYLGPVNSSYKIQSLGLVTED